ncbi:MAG TPA: CRTAC1 family protein [Planctomycetota bacterium]|nr:CRTAC1 family protein [Planctomycetota bacterium]
MKTLRILLLAVLSVAFWARTAEPQQEMNQELNFTPVPAEKSGLTHVLNSDAALGKVETPYLAPLIDINGDGKLDIIWFGHSGGGAALFLGKGDGSFEFQKEPYNKWWVWHAFSPLWWKLSEKNLIAVGTHATTGVFSRDDAGAWKKVSDADIPMLIDADGDGRFDEVWNSGVASLEPKLHDWNGSVPQKITLKSGWNVEDVTGFPATEKRNPHPLGPRFHYAFSVDLDGDHTNEMIVTFRGAQLHSWILERDPAAQGVTGWKAATEKRGLPAEPGHYLFPEDVNVDGALDLLDLASGEWYRNDGKGAFKKDDGRIFDLARKGGAPYTADGRFELLDLRNSGRRELVFTNFHGQERGLFSFAGELKSAFPLGRVTQSFGDVDGDGDLDAIVVKGGQLELLRNETKNGGLHLQLVPKAAAENELGCKIWVYAAGKLDDGKSLIHYRQCFMDRAKANDITLTGRVHVGIGNNAAVDIRVRFPSGVIKDVKGAKAGSVVRIEE